jgi:hypothetical protein
MQDIANSERPAPKRIPWNRYLGIEVDGALSIAEQIDL